MNEKAFKVLVVDDDELDRLAVRRTLRAAGLVVELDEEADPSGVAARLAATSYDCLIVDFSMPSETGLSLIKRLRAAGVHCPILALTGQGEETGAEMVEAGATDYMPKTDLTPTRLGRRLQFVIRVGRSEALLRDALSELAVERIQLNRAAKMREELLAIVSHDLRNPLNAVSVAVDELRDPALDTDTRDRYVRAIKQATARAGRLIDDLLDADLLEGGKLVVDANAVAARSLVEQVAREGELLAAEAKMRLEVTIEGEPKLLGDRHRLLQALGNLVGNAVRYGRTGGIVELRVDTVGDRVRICVADRGPGIAADALPHIFERYFQANRQRRGGAGLGLAIALGVTKAHGGSLTAENREGGGAQFTMILPRA